MSCKYKFHDNDKLYFVSYTNYIAYPNKSFKQTSKPAGLVQAGPQRQKESIVYTGLVAQDAVQLANKIGYNFRGIHKALNEKDNYSLDYRSFVVPLKIKALQEQQQIKAMECR